MSDLSSMPLNDLLDEALDHERGQPRAAVIEIRRRVAALEAERDEAYEDSRRSLDRLNRLVADKTGGIDPYTADGYLAHRLSEESNGRQAAESENARLREALTEIVDRHTRPCGVHESPLPCDVALSETYGIARAALEGGKDAG